MPAYASPLPTRDSQIHTDLAAAIVQLTQTLAAVDGLEGLLSPPLLVDSSTLVKPADLAALATAAKQDTLATKLTDGSARIGGTVAVGTATATASNDGSSVATGTSSAVLVASKADRAYLLLVNKGTSDVWISLGGAAVIGEGIPLWANGGGWELPENARYTGAVNAIGAVASTVAVTEF